MHRAGDLLRRFFGCDTDRLPRAHIDECRSHLSPVAELKSPLPEAASCDDADRVGGAAVNFHESDEPLSIFFVTERIVDSQLLQSHHCHPHAENLPGTEVAVGLLGIGQVFVKGFHEAVLTSQRILRWKLQICYFLFQRTPSFVFSTTIPALVSSARSASDALKSRDLRAASISVIFSLI